MSIKFRRNTHNEKGEYRSDEFFVNDKGETRDWCTELHYTGVHAFDKDIPLTFSEYYESLLKQSIGGAYHPRPPIISITNALTDLAKMIEYKLVNPILTEDIQNLQYQADEKSKI
jgi:hypothetical protein